MTIALHLGKSSLAFNCSFAYDWTPHPFHTSLRASSDHLRHSQKLPRHSRYERISRLQTFTHALDLSIAHRHHWEQQTDSRFETGGSLIEHTGSLDHSLASSRPCQQSAGSTRTKYVMAASFFSLPAELRNVIYQLYASQAAKSQAKAATFAVVGNRTIPPPLTYISHQVQKEFWPVWDKAKPDVLRAKKLRAIVVDLEFEPLLDYIWSLDEKAPLLSSKGELHLLLVFTERSLAVDRKTALSRKRDTHEWIDLLAELQEVPETDHKSERKPFLYKWRVQPPLPELAFEKSALMDAMAGCMFEMPELAALRIGKAKAARMRKRALEAEHEGSWEMEEQIGRWMQVGRQLGRT